MDAGKLDRRVAILRQSFGSDDGYTTQPGEWVTVATYWCQVMPQSGHEVIEASGKDGERLTLFRFRYDSTTSAITERDRLQHDDTIYAVTGPLIEVSRRAYIEVIGASVGAV